MIRKLLSSDEKRLLYSLILLETVWIAILGFITIRYFIPVMYIIISFIQYYAPLLLSFITGKLCSIIIPPLLLMYYQT